MFLLVLGASLLAVSHVTAGGFGNSSIPMSNSSWNGNNATGGNMTWGWNDTFPIGGNNTWNWNDTYPIVDNMTSSEEDNSDSSEESSSSSSSSEEHHGHHGGFNPFRPGSGGFRPPFGGRPHHGPQDGHLGGFNPFRPGSFNGRPHHRPQGGHHGFVAKLLPRLLFGKVMKGDPMKITFTKRTEVTFEQPGNRQPPIYPGGPGPMPFPAPMPMPSEPGQPMPVPMGAGSGQPISADSGAGFPGSFPGGMPPASMPMTMNAQSPIAEPNIFHPPIASPVGGTNQQAGF